MRVYDSLFRAEAIEQIFSDQQTVQSLLEFEAALASAEARVGLIPESAAKLIGVACQAKNFSLEALAAGAEKAGNLAIPLVKALSELVAKQDAEAAKYVHWGATSQDAIDTAMTLQLRSALEVVEKDLTRIAEALYGLAVTHKQTVMVGRTWMQQALPTTFGFVVAGWLDAVQRSRERLARVRANCLVLQFGGAVGTLAALGEKGPRVAKELADVLQLPLPSIAWHTQRDRFAEVAAALGICVGTLGKVSRDISLLAQTELGEVAEPSGEGRGGSSTMPHKRNPVTCAVVLAAAERVPGLVSTMLHAMVQEEQRGLGNWPAEWETLPQIARLCGGATSQLARMLPGLQVYPDRMTDNLEATRGLIFAEAVTMALAPAMGKQKAHALLEAACRTAHESKQHLRDVLLENHEVLGVISAADMEPLFDARRYLGGAAEFVDGVLAAAAG